MVKTKAIAVFNRHKRLKFWALFDGYRDLCKPLPSALDVRDLFKACDKAGLVTEAGIFFIQEEDKLKHAQVWQIMHEAQPSILLDPLDTLKAARETHDWTVNNIITAMKVTSEESSLIQNETLGQKENPCIVNGCLPVKTDC